jgi:hypothetical protein
MATVEHAQRFEFRYDRWCGWMLGLLGMGRRYSHVTVGADTVVVRMGWSFSTRIDRAAIRSAAHDDGSVWGWGVHGWRGRWLVNGSSHGLVRIEIDPPSRSTVIGIPIRLATLRVSVVDPDGLVAALGS